MARLRLTGYAGYWSGDKWIENRDVVKCEHRASATHGTIHIAYLHHEKLREMEANGYAYTNRPKEFMV